MGLKYKDKAGHGLKITSLNDHFFKLNRVRKHEM